MDAAEALGDFTATPRVLFISAIAIGIGVVSTFVAKALLAFINISTNLFYFQRLSAAPASPADNHLGLVAVAVPVAGALIIGLQITWMLNKELGFAIFAFELVIFGNIQFAGAGWAERDLRLHAF